jgi:hypothetical protein
MEAWTTQGVDTLLCEVVANMSECILQLQAGFNRDRGNQFGFAYCLVYCFETIVLDNSSGVSALVVLLFQSSAHMLLSLPTAAYSSVCALCSERSC